MPESFSRNSLGSGSLGGEVREDRDDGTHDFVVQLAVGLRRRGSVPSHSADALLSDADETTSEFNKCHAGKIVY